MIRKILLAVVVAGGLLFAWTGAAQAQTPTTDTCYGGCPPTTIVEPTSNPPRTTDPGNAVTTTVSSSGSTLPFTGADVAGTALIGVILLGAGVGLYATARRKSAAPN